MGLIPTVVLLFQKGFIPFIPFIPFIMILVIQEAYRNIRFWYDIDHYLTPCIALAACFYWFYVKHFELQLLYEMCYINKVLLTYLLTFQQTEWKGNTKWLVDSTALERFTLLKLLVVFTEMKIKLKPEIMKFGSGWRQFFPSLTIKLSSFSFRVYIIWHSRQFD